MSIFDALMGNSSKVDLVKLAEEFSPLLVAGEELKGAYRLVRDMFVFTNKRCILVDRQGVTGRKTEYLSIPYQDIARYSVESAGSFDMDAELKIWLRGEAQPIVKSFPKGSEYLSVHRMLSEGVLK
ncbi:PH domain-containing protein [Falsiroseomonas tokyonensis]|uniref:PH domain-containing protein n=1 Tax=Falsiroseomonas tokyonensis TaxID=430521 RepID=A0ABV7BZR6_9PROT|nr:PH domain-containing protein [Falsiroseomonas tokyonensis]